MPNSNGGHSASFRSSSSPYMQSSSFGLPPTTSATLFNDSEKGKGKASDKRETVKHSSRSLSSSASISAGTYEASSGLSDGSSLPNRSIAASSNYVEGSNGRSGNGNHSTPLGSSISVEEAIWLTSRSVAMPMSNRGLNRDNIMPTDTTDGISPSTPAAPLNFPAPPPVPRPLYTSTQSTSLLNRPRPQLPGTHSRSWTQSSSPPSSLHRPILSMSTTEPVRSGTNHSRESSSPSSLKPDSDHSEKELSSSLLDRPRPRTPDPNSPSSIHTAPLTPTFTSSRTYSRSSPSRSSPSSLLRLSPLSVPSRTATSIFSSDATVSTPRSSATGTSFDEEDVESNERTMGDRHISTAAPAPLLKLELELDDSTDETMFDIPRYFSADGGGNSPMMPDFEENAVAKRTPEKRAPVPLVLKGMALRKKIELDRDEAVDRFEDGGDGQESEAKEDGESTPLASSFVVTLDTATPSPGSPIDHHLTRSTPLRTTSLTLISSHTSTADQPFLPLHRPVPRSQVDTSAPFMSNVQIPAPPPRRRSLSLLSVSTAGSSSSITSSSSTSSRRHIDVARRRGSPHLMPLALKGPTSDPAIDKSLPPTPTFSPIASGASTFVIPSPSSASDITATHQIKSSPLIRQLSKLRAGPRDESPSKQGRARNVSIESSSSETRSVSPELTRPRFGKRFIERFTLSKSSSSSQAASLPRDESRVDYTTSAGSARSASNPAEKKKGASLGMGMSVARKSSDVLNGGGISEKMSTKLDGIERSSSDVFSSSSHKSSDSLLSIATGKISKMVGGGARGAMPSSKSNTSNSLANSQSWTTTSTTDSMRSLSSIDRSPEKVSVTTATRIGRADPISFEGYSNSIATASAIVARAQPNLPRTAQLQKSDAASVIVASPSLESNRRKRVKVPDSGVGSDTSVTNNWGELDDVCSAYINAITSEQLERGTMLTTVVLPFLRREESRTTVEEMTVAKSNRAVLFKWLAVLTDELRDTQPVHRGSCLETVAAIAESRLMAATILARDEIDRAKYRSAIVRLIHFAITKLNEKAVYANTLVLSGRILALAFFRIEGVGLKLLRSLPPIKRSFLKRILTEVGVDELNLPPVDLELYPSHLWKLCLRDFSDYTSLLVPLVRRPPSDDDRFLVQDGEIEVEMTGNWLIRWTASDSDLSFSFYRSYHRQLASYLVSPQQRFDISSRPLLTPASIICAPAFLFLAASLLEKCDALVHRNLRSVTSIGPTNGTNFNTNDSANLEVGRKPKVLELANRRLVSTMLDIVGGPPTSPGEPSDVAPDADIRRHAFSSMLQIWIRASVRRTSMYDTRSVFILLDLLEGLIYTLSYPVATERTTIAPPELACLEMFDIPFIFSFIKTILSTADNTVTVTRTIAFLYAHFELLTFRSADRRELCEMIILDEQLFLRLYLSWNGAIRSYFIRLLVWRVARLGIVPIPSAASIKGGSVQRRSASIDKTNPDIVRIFGLLNVRLEMIRRRHDELEPVDEETAEDDFLYRPKRSTICSTRGVKECPYTVEAIPPSSRFEDDSEPNEALEIVEKKSLGGSSNGTNGVKEVSKVVSWLKISLSKARAANKSKSNGIGGFKDVRIDPFRMSAESIIPVVEAEDRSRLIDAELERAEAEDNFDGTSLTPTSAPIVHIEELPPVSDLVPRPESPAFFSFEFEGSTSLVSRVPAPSSPKSPLLLSSSSKIPTSPISPVFRRASDLDLARRGSTSSKVSKRFSKRQSILPPAALEALEGIGEAVPSIPVRYREQGYDRKLHPYAIRGLRDYEDALDEWSEWTARLREEEEPQNTGFIDEVPRLSVPWHTGFED